MNAERQSDDAPLFLYQHGQHVCWAGSPDVRWRILWRRYTEPEVMAGYVEYRLEPVDVAQARAGGAGTWAYEADVTPWAATP